MAAFHAEIPPPLRKNKFVINRPLIDYMLEVAEGAENSTVVDVDGPRVAPRRACNAAPSHSQLQGLEEGDTLFVTPQAGVGAVQVLLLDVDFDGLRLVYTGLRVGRVDTGGKIPIEFGAGDIVGIL